MICFYLFFALLCNQKNKNKKVNLIIDIGNTVAKLAVFPMSIIKFTFLFLFFWLQSNAKNK